MKIVRFYAMESIVQSLLAEIIHDPQAVYQSSVASFGTEKTFLVINKGVAVEIRELKNGQIDVLDSLQMEGFIVWGSAIHVPDSKMDLLVVCVKKEVFFCQWKEVGFDILASLNLLEKLESGRIFVSNTFWLNSKEEGLCGAFVLGNNADEPILIKFKTTIDEETFSEFDISDKVSFAIRSVLDHRTTLVID